MRIHDSRLLNRFGLTAAQWAVLFAASYYITVPQEQFIELTIRDSDGDLSEEEIETALPQCFAKKWVMSDSTERRNSADLHYFGASYPDQGIILTDNGAALKNQVCAALLTTVLNIRR